MATLRIHDDSEIIKEGNSRGKAATFVMIINTSRSMIVIKIQRELNLWSMHAVSVPRSADRRELGHLLVWMTNRGAWRGSHQIQK